jgi:3-oxoacyl-[acyl-carrier-protein] synthase-3
MIKFKEIKVTIGKKKIYNSELEKDFKLKKKTILNKTGIFSRYISSKNQTSESIALECVNKLNKKNLKKITHIISVTNTPSYAFPSISHFIASKLNIKKNLNCIGVNSGCSGYADAIIMSYDIIKSNKNANILLTTSDTYSKFIRKNDKYIKCLFSDGGSATIIVYSKKGWRIKKQFSETVPNTQDYLKMENMNKEKQYITMDGPQIVAFAIEKVIPKLKEFIVKKNITLLMHQAGKIIIELVKNSVIKKKNIFFPTNFRNFGNLVSTSIPLILYQNFRKVNLSKEIIICGFGVGLTHTHIMLKKN